MTRQTFLGLAASFIVFFITTSIKPVNSSQITGNLGSPYEISGIDEFILWYAGFRVLNLMNL